MQDSPYQQAIYQAVQFTKSNLVVKSTAGSGKTTTGVKATTLVPFDRRAVFIAFNKHTVKELKERLDERIDCFTIHSIGARSIHACYNEVRVNVDKQLNYIKPLFEREKDHKKKWKKIYEVDKLMSLVRATLTELTIEKVKELGEKHNLYPEDEIILSTITATRNLYNYNQDTERNGIEIDFQDMISLPALRKDIRVPQYDYVFVDEAQDCSALDQKLIERIIKPIKGRLIAFGDDKQAIYQFRGSDINSFDYFKNRPNTVELPLTVSYRCGKEIVNKAREVYKDIEPWEKAIQGEVSETDNLDEVKDGDMVLCRNLRPLVDAFLQLIEMGKRSVIVGKDLEKGLVNLISQLDDSQGVNEIKEELDRQMELLKQQLKQKNVTNFTLNPKVLLLEEKINVINLLSSSCNNVGEVIAKLESIFSDDIDQAPIKLMTIHKAKGMESDNVFLIEEYENKALIPSKYAVTKDQLTQEENLRFVAYTRAKKRLVLVDL
jgi:DNA helicase-2/ATP-dependent DNA helicase PcrA